MNSQNEIFNVQDDLDSTAQIGCHNSHTIEVLASPLAQLSVSASEGVSPLSIQITNNSTNASDFEWYVNNEFVGTTLSNCTFSEIGNYELKLVATLDGYSCKDSAIQTIMVQEQEELAFQIGPNPNNGFFSVLSNDKTTEQAKIAIYNAIGAKILDETYSFEEGKSDFQLFLASGVYWIEITELETNQKFRKRMVVV